MNIFVISSVMLVELLPSASYMINSLENQGYQMNYSLSFLFILFTFVLDRTQSDIQK